MSRRLEVTAPNEWGEYVRECLFDPTRCNLGEDSEKPNMVVEMTGRKNTVFMVTVPGPAVSGTLEHLRKSGIGVTVGRVILTTIDYLKTRKQFGKPLAEFQVLRHRVADMVMATEQTRSLALAAANALDGEPGLGARFAAAAKVQAGQAGKFVGESAVQLHGGIGVTDELHVGHFFKRLLCIDVLLGDAAFYLRRVAGLDPGLQAG